MNKLIVILLFILPLFSIGQVTFQNGKIAMSSNGDFTYTLPYCEGNADSINYTITVGAQNVYYKINSGLVNWREVDGYTCQGDSVQIPITGTYKIETFISATTNNANDFIRLRIFINNTKPTGSYGRFIIVSNGNTAVTVPSYYNANFKLNAGDWISWRVTNLTAIKDIKIGDIKFILTKLAKQ